MVFLCVLMEVLKFLFYQWVQVPEGWVKEPGFFQWCSGTRPEATGMLWNTGASLWTSETLFYCDCDWALAQLAQRSSNVSLPGDIQKLSGHGPGQLTLGGSAWAGELDKMTSRGPIPPQLICDSVTGEQTQPTLVEPFHFFFLKYYLISKHNSIDL